MARPFSLGANGTTNMGLIIQKAMVINLQNVKKEMTDKGNEILKDFKEEKEGESNILKEKLLKQIH